MDHPFYIEQQPYQGQSVLVTGGAGFIGRHLLDALLTAQASVTVVDKLSGSCRQTNKAFLNQVRFVEGDVADLACMSQVVRQTPPTVVFHLAANASVPNSIADPIADFESNSRGTLMLLEALRQWGGCQKIVLVSSGAVYGEPTTLPIRKIEAPCPHLPLRCE